MDIAILALVRQSFSYAGTFALVLLSISFLETAPAQLSTRVSSVTPTETAAGVPVTVQVELFAAETVEAMYFLYRPFGRSEWTKLDMDIIGNIATVRLPIRDVISPSIEYYVVLMDRLGSLETYPLSETDDPLSTPPQRTAQIAIRAEEELDEQVIFLTPEPSASVSPEDVLISVSLLRADSLVERRSTRMLLDGADVTADAVFADDIIVYAPENLAVRLTPGNHRVTVNLFDRAGNLYRSSSLMFSVTGSPLYADPASSEFLYGVSVQLESRREQVGGAGTWYNRGGAQFSGKTEIMRFNSNIFVTSDEEISRQPQNRYFISAQNDWLKVSYGDSYPAFPNLVLNGKRVRGLTSSLKLNLFNLDLTLGKTTRGIEGALLKQFPLDSLSAEQTRDPNAPYAQIDPQTQTWGKFSYGTFERDLFAIRPSFGSGKTWQVGFTWLKSKDDVGSIRFGSRPQENFVVGTDFMVKLDDGRFELGGQGAFSAFNSDISSGTFSDEKIDSLFEDPEKARDAKKVRNNLQDFITVNENITPLSFKKLPTIAYDASLSLNYFDNAFKFMYLLRGSSYNSLGQTFLRKDVRGFNITDRIRLAREVFTTLGYERLADNTSDMKIATTTFNTYNISVSYYSQIGLPNATIGFTRFDNSNGLSIAGSDSLSVVDEGTNRFFLQSSYDLVGDARHTLSLNFSLSDRTDNSLRRQDVNNMMLAMGVVTRYGMPLQTGAEIAFNFNKFPAGTGTQAEFNYTTISVSGKYSMLNNALQYAAVVSPTLGDFTRTGIDLSTQWTAMSGMSFVLQFTFFSNKGRPNDNLWSFRYRYDL